MPKKRVHNFKNLQGASSSSSKQAATQNGDDSNTASVNERLSELRKLEGKEAVAKARQLAESVNFKRSVPPDVHRILGVPESAPPRAKAGVRTRERMRTPGPAPPKSWLARNNAWTTTLALRGPRRGLKKNADKSNRNRPRELLLFARLTGLQDVPVDVKPPSLTHLTLKHIAESWDLLDEEDYPALVEIPLRLRLKLISYIGFYGPALDSNGLQALLQGSEAVRHVDLGGLIGHGNLSVKKLLRLVEKEQEAEIGDEENEVAESWDADESALQPSLRINRFSQLTHLCLSHPAPTVLWRDLLGLAKLTPQITHLSLAYWPRPTLTPNLATATVSSHRSPDVTAGGSHYYSGLDQDMSEPASLLRQLSSSLLCLQWLDIEGCQEWMPALAKLTADTFVVEPFATRRGNDNWSAGSLSTVSVLSSNWKNLSYLRCGQGWLPSQTGVQADLAVRDTVSLDRLLGTGFTKRLQDSVADVSESEQPSQDVLDVEKRKAGMWLECEYGLLHACIRINTARRAQGCKGIMMDFGWAKRHVATP